MLLQDFQRWSFLIKPGPVLTSWTCQTKWLRAEINGEQEKMTVFILYKGGEGDFQCTSVIDNKFGKSYTIIITLSILELWSLQILSVKQVKS